MRKRHDGNVFPWVPALFLSLFILPGAIQAQTSLEVRDELMGQFNASMRKVIALADAMPAETYTWSPGEGVMEVGHVYMHLARYNYLYPTQNLGETLPDGVEMDQMESVRDKEQILAVLFYICCQMQVLSHPFFSLFDIGNEFEPVFPDLPFLFSNWF